MSLHVEAGEILGIVGPNGSGKTSLVKLLAKLASEAFELIVAEAGEALAGLEW